MAPITLLNKGSLVAQMGEKQSDLDKLVPLNYIMNWIGQKLATKNASSMSDRVIVLNSKTGSGKSSSIAPSIYLRHFPKYRSNIIITQPRVLTAVDIPRDISEIDAYKIPDKDTKLTLELFRNLGYQTQDYVQKPTEKGILFATTGILLQLLKMVPDQKFCKRFKFVIIDEAHDRSLDVDLILLMMKRLIKRTLSTNPPFLILMSATLNVKQYCQYFDTKTVFEVSGQSKPIEVIYPSVDVDNIYAKTCEIVSQLELYEEKNPSYTIEKGIRDVIVFIPVTASIKKMVMALNKLNPSLNKKILPISITSAEISGGGDGYRLIMEDYRKLKVEVEGKWVPAFRRVIVSTNVAETGLTLESLRYCVDTGLQFTIEFNPRYGLMVMMTKPTTSSMSLQRKGRVGRKHPGVFYPLFTEQTFNDMIVNNTPNVMVENMTSHMLALFANEPVISLDRLLVYDMITPPSDDSINYSLEQLYTLGAIDSFGNITALGRMMNSFRKVNLESCKMILSGLVYGASLKELVCLTCLLMEKKSDLFLDRRVTNVAPYDTGLLIDELYQITPTFDRSKCDTANFNRLKGKLLVGCEMLELLLIYQRFTAKAENVSSTAELSQWCFSKGLNFSRFCKLTETINEINWGMMEQLKINPVSKSSQHEELYQVLKRSGDVNNTELVEAVIALKKCIYEGYKNNVLIWNSNVNSYQTRAGLNVVVDSKVVSRLSYQKLGARFEQEHPRILLYKDLITHQDRRGRYCHEASLISVMDGYVHVDVEFTKS